MAETDPAAFEKITATMKKAAAALDRAEIPFLLGGALAAWARGGPPSFKDLDLLVKPEDAEEALAVLEQEGMRREIPPEDWLVKIWDGDVLVDLIFRPLGIVVNDDVIARGDQMQVLSMPMRVMALEDLMSSKLLSLNEHSLDLESPLRIARSLREQIDWATVWERSRRSPYARAFFSLLDELGVVAETARRGGAVEAAAGGGAGA